MNKAARIIFLLFMVAMMTVGQTKWNVDKSHTMINFSVSHMMISEVTGQFREFDATLESAKEDFTDAKISVVIKSRSIDTGTNGRDKHLRSADFFNAEVDSNITFISSNFSFREKLSYCGFIRCSESNSNFKIF